MSLSSRIREQPRNAPALRIDGRCSTFGSLNERVSTRADELAQSAGYVLLDHPRGIDWIVDLLASWRVGRVPVLVDPLDPPARRAALLTQLEAFEAPAATAYIAFTSGSSGRPTGVALGTRGLERMVEAQIDAFDLGPGCRAGWMLHPGFDASLSDVLTALVSGAELVVHTGEAHDLGWLDGLTHIDLPPALLPALLAQGVPPRLSTIVFGGELAHERTVRRLAQRCHVLNLYGPTETTVCSSLKRCDAHWTSGEIGEPIPGTSFHVQDGELWIAGEGVALAPLTPDDPRFTRIDGERAFRTGDRVEHRAAGLTFLGRLDRQVQIRGKRVQLEAIESVMRRVTGVEAARASVLGHRLVARYEGPAGLADVQAALERALRPHERPDVQRGALTRTDRLKASDPEPPSVAALVEVVRAVVSANAVHADHPIAALGLDSVDRLTISALAQQRGLSLEPDDLSDERSLAEALRQGGGSNRSVAELRTLVETAHELALGAGESSPSAEGEGILLSGGSGLLGTALLEVLPGLVAAPIHCLVRSTPPAGRFATVAGDVSRPLWGLTARAIEALRGRVGHVVHLAGRVDLTRGYAALAPVNVHGTAHAIALARTLGARLHFASSLSVFAESDATGELAPSTPLEAATSVRGGYAQSKWVAEALVRDHAPDATISRLGLLVPDRPGGADQLSRVVRGLRSLGHAPVLPDSSLAFDCTPVAHAARALARIIVGGAGTYHIANPVSARAAALLQALGLPVREAWPPRTPTTRDEAVAVAAFRRAQGHYGFAGDLFLATGRSFVCPRAWSLVGGRPPEPNGGFLRTLVDRIGGVE